MSLSPREDLLLFTTDTN